ncbi:MAG: SIMPL domain-containing protein [Candidatus Levybacteria bacterium]|nr:SIMPL domain-containing protein [Candidatus Levybacteria bacterium]
MKQQLLVVLFIFFGLFLYTRLFGAIPFSVTSVTTTKSNLFKVTGTAKATAIPNTAKLSLGLTKTSDSVASAQNQVNTVVNKIIDDLKKLGIEEKNIKTTNYNVNPQYDFSAGRQTVTGYTVTQSLEVKVKPIDKTNQAIDIATADGANLVGGITFILDDKTIKELEQKARKEAVANAKEKAQSLANAAGIILGKIIDVQETSRPNGFRPMVAKVDQISGEETTLPPGENTIEITVTLFYETR